MQLLRIRTNSPGELRSQKHFAKNDEKFGRPFGAFQTGLGQAPASIGDEDFLGTDRDGEVRGTKKGEDSDDDDPEPHDVPDGLDAEPVPAVGRRKLWRVADGILRGSADAGPARLVSAGTWSDGARHVA